MILFTYIQERDTNHKYPGKDNILNNIQWREFIHQFSGGDCIHKHLENIKKYIKGVDKKPNYFQFWNEKKKEEYFIFNDILGKDSIKFS